ESTGYRIEDRASNAIATYTDSRNFSENGKWIVVHASYRGFVRINVENGDVLPFSAGYTYNQGFSRFTTTTISNDGRYAVVASRTPLRLTLHDLSTCSEPPDNLSTYTDLGCQYIDLLPIIQSEGSGLTSISRIRFVANESVRFFANFNTGSGNALKEYSINAGGFSKLPIDYLAF